MVRRIPKIEESGLQSIHVGRDGLTPDQRAIYSAAGTRFLSRLRQAAPAGAFPAAGACLAELILDGKPKTVDITPSALVASPKETTPRRIRIRTTSGSRRKTAGELTVLSTASDLAVDSVLFLL